MRGRAYPARTAPGRGRELGASRAARAVCAGRAKGPRAAPSVLAPSREGARTRRMVLRAAEPRPPGRLNSLLLHRVGDLSAPHSVRSQFVSQRHDHVTKTAENDRTNANGLCTKLTDWPCRIDSFADHPTTALPTLNIQLRSIH